MSRIIATAVHTSPASRALAAVRRPGLVPLAMVLTVAAGFATRLALLGKSAGVVSWNASLLASFAWGSLFDFAAALWWAAPLALLVSAIPPRVFSRRPVRMLVHGAFLALLGQLLFVGVAEWVFWDEFGARFNFIAVDYLVYTKEVIGNIRESYPMPAIYAGIAVLASIGYLGLRRTRWITRALDAAAANVSPWRRRLLFAAGWIVALAAFCIGLRQGALPAFANAYNLELAKNGTWSLFAAFRDNQLDYDRFYPTLPVDQAFTRVHRLLAHDGSQPLTDDPCDLLRLVGHEGPERKLNVIQITVESLSADFLSAFNRASHLTPNLDAIGRQSLVFEQFYATGTRTDRGMEALTLSVPPTPGRSLVKRPDNAHLFTLGSVFRAKGYNTAFVYGGFGYFDNMNAFFGGNGYRVIDRTTVKSDDITFANIWGACDEDLYRWALREADRDFTAGTPFFHFVMTTSNHRPFTFPDGRIDLPSKVSGRSGAVKYSDYAIGEFLRAAATRPWFKDTLFVIVADHCASSAGKAELPVQNYHIPLLVYAPGGQVKPGRVRTLTSQIDYAPTLLGLLHWTYPSRFYGRDVLAASSAAADRALVGNYQKLGLLRAGELAVLKPVRATSVLDYDGSTTRPALRASDPDLVADAIAYYQTASWLFRHGRQGELKPAERPTAPRITASTNRGNRP